MIVLRRFLLLMAACIGLVASPAFAQAIDAADRAAIQTRVDQYSTAFATSDYSTLYEMTMAPGLRAEFRKRYNVTDAQIREVVLAEMARLMSAGVSVVEHDMNVDGATAAVTPDGSRGYLLIPTRVLLDAQGNGRMLSRNHTLAIKDEGQWHLLRIDDGSQINLIRAAYPEFVGVNFPIGTAEAAD